MIENINSYSKHTKNHLTKLILSVLIAKLTFKHLVLFINIEKEKIY